MNAMTPKLDAVVELTMNTDDFIKELVYIIEPERFGDVDYEDKIRKIMTTSSLEKRVLIFLYILDVHYDFVFDDNKKGKNKSVCDYLASFKKEIKILLEILAAGDECDNVADIEFTKIETQYGIKLNRNGYLHSMYNTARKSA